MGKGKKDEKPKGKAKEPKTEKDAKPVEPEETEPEESVTEPVDEEPIEEEAVEAKSAEVVMPPAQTGVPKARGEKTTKVTIVNNSSRLIDLSYPNGRTSLKPGPNAVDRHLYEKHFRDHSTVKLYSGMSVGSQRLEPGKPAILEIDESGPPSTINRAVEDAVLFVNKVCDLDLLYVLQESDPRAPVQKACDERKEAIGPTPVKKD
jgi:hypothetical protein